MSFQDEIDDMLDDVQGVMAESIDITPRVKGARNASTGKTLMTTAEVFTLTATRGPSDRVPGPGRSYSEVVRFRVRKSQLAARTISTDDLVGAGDGSWEVFAVSSSASVRLIDLHCGRKSA